MKKSLLQFSNYIIVYKRYLICFPYFINELILKQYIIFNFYLIFHLI